MSHLPTCPETCADHHFTGEQQAQYDSLRHRGRSLYDDLRWTHGATHEEAYTEALRAYGSKEASR